MMRARARCRQSGNRLSRSYGARIAGLRDYSDETILGDVAGGPTGRDFGSEPLARKNVIDMIAVEKRE